MTGSQSGFSAWLLQLTRGRPGCSIGGVLRDWIHLGFTGGFLFLTALACLVVPTAGCDTSPASSEDPQALNRRVASSSSPLENILPHRPAGSEAPREIRAIRLFLYRLEVPVGQLSGTEQVWSYLDEEAVGASKNLTLGLNGIRVGLGRGQDWPDVAEAIRRLTGQSLAEGLSSILPGQAKHLAMKKEHDPMTLFIFRDNRTLTGQDVPAGDYVLTLSCTVHENDPREVLFTALPQMRTVGNIPEKRFQGRVMSWKKGPKFEPFLAALFQLPIPKDGFLLIGPGSQSRRPSSLGNQLLVSQKDGLPFETIIVVKPELFSAPLISSRMQ